MSGYRKALLWLATHVAAGVLGLQTAAAQCQNMGFGINQVCVELGACLLQGVHPDGLLRDSWLLQSR